MYPYFPFNPELTDPVAIERQETRRPATHLEVIQRNRQVDRRHWLAITEREEAARSRQNRTPALFEGIRRSLSRVLIQAGHRIDPQTA